MKKKKKKKNIKLKNIVKYIAIFIYNCTYGFFLIKRYKVKLVCNEAKGIKGSYVLLANHVTNFDGCFLFQYIRRPISVVINDKAFRNTHLRRALLFFDMIPKKKFSSDINTVRNIFKAKKRGDVIGIFPEGKRNWDGSTTHIIESTASLVKSLKLPLVCAKIMGGATTSPRWHNGKINRGRVEISIKQILNINEITTLSSDEIYEHIKDALSHNEAQYIQENQKTKYNGIAPALGLERFLFICPDCKEISTLKSNNTHISCACGYSQEYTCNGQLSGEPFSNIREYSIWQNQEVESILSKASNDEILLTDSKVSLFSASGREKFIKNDEGMLTLTKQVLTFKGNNDAKFSLKELYGASIQSNSVLEFNIKDICYRIKMPMFGNAYKYQVYLNAIVKKK